MLQRAGRPMFIPTYTFQWSNGRSNETMCSFARVNITFKFSFVDYPNMGSVILYWSGHVGRAVIYHASLSDFRQESLYVYVAPNGKKIC